MIVVLKASNTDVILMDCVPSFSEGYNGTITSHPIENGSKITDHFIVDNTKIKISGVVSDYNFINPLKSQAVKIDGYSDKLYNSQYNSRVGATQNIVVPSLSIAQALTSEAVRKRLIAIHSNGEFVEIFLYSEVGGQIDSFQNCLLTSLDFKVDPDSGYAIYPEMQFERVKIVNVRVTQGKASKIPKYGGQGQEGNDLGSVAQDAKNAIKQADLPKPETNAERAVDALHNRTDEILKKKQDAFEQRQRDQATRERMMKVLGY